jgi:hypothetical protein
VKIIIQIMLWVKKHLFVHVRVKGKVFKCGQLRRLKQDLRTWQRTFGLHISCQFLDLLNNYYLLKRKSQRVPYDLSVSQSDVFISSSEGLPVNPMLCLTNLLHMLAFYFIKIFFNNFLPSTLRSPKWFLSFRISTYSCVLVCYAYHTCLISSSWWYLVKTTN